MAQQPEALRLADALTEKEYPPRRAAAAELRRLHSVNAQLLGALDDLAGYVDTCELFLKEAHPGKAAALRGRVTKAIEAMATARRNI